MMNKAGDASVDVAIRGKLQDDVGFERVDFSGEAVGDEDAREERRRRLQTVGSDESLAVEDERAEGWVAVAFAPNDRGRGATGGRADPCEAHARADRDALAVEHRARNGGRTQE